MANIKNITGYLYWVMIFIIAIQFVMLFFRNVGFLPLWTLIEYMQLIAFMPIYNFKMIPYLYDIFKPFLVAHLILFDRSIFFTELSDDFFNYNYRYYNLPVAKLLQSLVNTIILLAVIFLFNFLVFLISVCCRGGR
jgi:hypothetical protein